MRNRISFSCHMCLDFTFSPFFSWFNICSRKSSFSCQSKLSKFMTNPSFVDLTTNRSFSIVNSYGAINEFWQNQRSTWPNFPVQKRISLLLHSQQECINKNALPYRSSWHELRISSLRFCPYSQKKKKKKIKASLLLLLLLFLHHHWFFVLVIV